MEQTRGNHETFRPVSILDKGLEINEDDMAYDAYNPRATLAHDLDKQSEYRPSEYLRKSYREGTYIDTVHGEDVSYNIDAHQFQFMDGESPEV